MKASLVFYTDLIIPDRFEGYTIGPVILIRPSHRDDKGLLEHERVHVRQFWRTLGLHALVYRFSRAYRLRCEVEAYRQQIKHTQDADPMVFARLLADKYLLGITVNEALALLKD